MLALQRLFETLIAGRKAECLTYLLIAHIECIPLCELLAGIERGCIARQYMTAINIVAGESEAQPGRDTGIKRGENDGIHARRQSQNGQCCFIVVACRRNANPELHPRRNSNIDMLTTAKAKLISDFFEEIAIVNDIL